MITRSQRLARRLSLLTEDLLAVSTAGHSALDVVVDSLDLTEALEMVAEAYTERDVRVECEPGLRVMADPLRLQQVLDNLVTNAVKYGAEPVILRGLSPSRRRLAVNRRARSGSRSPTPAPACPPRSSSVSSSATPAPRATPSTAPAWASRWWPTWSAPTAAGSPTSWTATPSSSSWPPPSSPAPLPIGYRNG